MDNSNTVYLYNDEIDLRIYIKAILNWWVWILAAAILSGLAAFVVLTSFPATFASTALISVSSPSLNVQFDSSITLDEETVATLQNNDLPTLALSDEIIQSLFELVQDRLPENITNYVELKNYLDASTETRSEIVILTGTFAEADLSALVVNEWSQLFVKSANLFLEGSQEDSQQFFQEQFAESKQEREAIDQELIEFQSQNTLSLIKTQIDADKNLQQNYVNRRNALEILLYDIQGLKKQIEQSPDNQNVLNELTLFSLQNRAFNTGSVNVQIQVSSINGLSTSTLEDRVALLNTLESTIKSQQAELEGLIAGIDPLILFRQQQIQELSTKVADLESRRKIIHDTYEILALKVAEGDIEQNNISGKAQIASRAIVPVIAEPRNRVTTSALVSIVAAMLSVGVILIYAWWIDEGSNTASVADQVVPSFSNRNGSDYSVGPVTGNGNGAHPKEVEELPAND